MDPGHLFFTIVTNKFWDDVRQGSSRYSLTSAIDENAK